MKTFSFVLAWVCVGFMLVCLFSGFIVFEYNPFDAFKSTQHITFRVPYGDFLRSLHYFSGELFLIASLIHVGVELYKDANIKILSWIYSIVALGICVFLMFSGYVLKGDLNGISAGQISLNLMVQTPILSDFLFFVKGNSFFYRFFLLHCIVMPTVLIYAVYKHAHSVFTKYFLPAFAITLFVMLFFSIPTDLNPLNFTDETSGPWFFISVESMLDIGILPQFAVFVILLPFLLLFVIGFLQNQNAKLGLKILLFIWLIFYAFFYFV